MKRELPFLKFRKAAKPLKVKWFEKSWRAPLTRRIEPAPIRAFSFSIRQELARQARIKARVEESIVILLAAALGSMKPACAGFGRE
jgi:hypothetical protein